MTRWKSTLVLLTVTVAVGAYVSLYEIKQPPPEQRRERAKRILTLSPNAISEVTIERSHEPPVTLVREGTVWRLSAAPSAAQAGLGAAGGLRADPGAISDLLEYASALQAERTLLGPEGKPLEAAAYGLEPPAARLLLREGARTVALRFGEATAVAGRRYVQVEGQPQIAVVSSVLFDAITRPADAFRDAQLIRFSHYDAEEFTVATPTTLARLARGADAWYLVEPVADAADRGGINGLLGKLAALNTTRVLEPDDSDPADPRARLGELQTLLILRTSGASPGTTEVRIGAPLAADPTLVPALRSDEPHVYAVRASDVADLVPNPQELREPACVTFFQSQVQRVGVSWQDRAWDIERAQEGWREVASGDALDAATVETWLQRLAELRAQAFVEAPQDLGRYGLTPPSGVVSVWTDAPAPQRLLIGSLMGDPAGRYGWLEPREVLVQLPAAAEELALTTLESLRPPTPDAMSGSVPESTAAPAPPAAAR